MNQMIDIMTDDQLILQAVNDAWRVCYDLCRFESMLTGYVKPGELRFLSRLKLHVRPFRVYTDKPIKSVALLPDDVKTFILDAAERSTSKLISVEILYLPKSKRGKSESKASFYRRVSESLIDRRERSFMFLYLEAGKYSEKRARIYVPGGKGFTVGAFTEPFE